MSKYSLLFLVALFLFLTPLFVKAVNYNSGTYNSGFYSSTQPETPVALPAAGIYNVTQSVAISATSSSYLRYSTTQIPADCSSGTLYSGPLTISYSQTIYVRACNDVGNSSTASFTYTIDTNAPIISAISYNPSNTTVIIAWTTDKAASSRVDYGLTSNYGASTIEADISPRATSHNMTISELSLCTTYHYRIRSKDSASNESISPDQSFTTSGCTAAPSSWTSRPAVPEGGFKVLTNGNSLTFNAGTDVKKMAISLNSDFSDASLEDYVKTKQINLCSSSCTVYIRFYTEYGGASDTISQVINIQPAESVVAPSLPSSTIKDLRLGAQDIRIKNLQNFLNLNGFKVADKGAGSLGKETNYFGALTARALIKFQEANKLMTEKGYLGKKTQEFIDSFKKPVQPATTIKTTDIFKRSLFKGLKSSDVSQLQKWLSTTDLYPEKLITGYFGSATEKAVQRFQLKYKLVNSSSDSGYGVVGPKTRSKLLEIFSK